MPNQPLSVLGVDDNKDEIRDFIWTMKRKFGIDDGFDKAYTRQESLKKLETSRYNFEIIDIDCTDIGYGS